MNLWANMKQLTNIYLRSEAWPPECKICRNNHVVMFHISVSLYFEKDKYDTEPLQCPRREQAKLNKQTHQQHGPCHELLSKIVHPICRKSHIHHFVVTTNY